MNFGDIINLIYRSVEQDPMSFMVVYPMTLLTGVMLIFALIQDLIPVYRTKLAHATIRKPHRTKASPAFKRSLKAGGFFYGK